MEGERKLQGVTRSVGFHRNHSISTLITKWIKEKRQKQSQKERKEEIKKKRKKIKRKDNLSGTD